MIKRTIINKTGRYYKDKYLIALYDQYDIPHGIYDNPRELANAFNKKVNIITSHLGKIFNKKDSRKKIFGYYVYFIDYLEQ